MAKNVSRVQVDVCAKFEVIPWMHEICQKCCSWKWGNKQSRWTCPSNLISSSLCPGLNNSWKVFVRYRGRKTWGLNSMSQAKHNHPHQLMITLKTWRQKTALYLYCVVELLSLYTVNMMQNAKSYIFVSSDKQTFLFIAFTFAHSFVYSVSFLSSFKMWINLKVDRPIVV